MLDGDAVNFIRTKFQTDIVLAELGDASDFPIQYDNAPSINKKNVQNWASFRINIIDSSQVSIGQKNRHRNLGLAIAGVFARIEDGDEVIRKLADKIKTAFTSTVQNAVTYRTPIIRVIGKINNLGDIEPNVWYQINVECPFYFDHIA